MIMRRFLAVVLVVALGVTAHVARSQHEHEQEHHAREGAMAGLELDAGRKWPTDASLRAGMAEIRNAFEADHPRIHAGTESDAEYAALASRVEEQVHFIIEHCKLPPAADANLHLLIADLLTAVRLMRGEIADRSRHDGAALVHTALEAYGSYFDDPGWQSGD